MDGHRLTHPDPFGMRVLGQRMDGAAGPTGGVPSTPGDKTRAAHGSGAGGVPGHGVPREKVPLVAVTPRVGRTSSRPGGWARFSPPGRIASLPLSGGTRGPVIQLGGVSSTPAGLTRGWW